MTSHLSFHESTVTAFLKNADVVHLALTDVRSSGGIHAAEIRIGGVSRIIVDGAEVGSVGMEHDDGEVLTLDLSDREVSAIVQWNDFARHTSITRSYRIEGESVRLALSAPFNESET